MGDEAKPFHNPFAALRDLGSGLPQQSESTPAPLAKTAPEPPAKGVPRAVVRLERSGRGGKEVTVVEHLELKPAVRAEWLKGLKAALGCGGTVEGDTLVLQGDQRKRLPQLLSRRGVKRITVA